MGGSKASLNDIVKKMGFDDTKEVNNKISEPENNRQPVLQPQQQNFGKLTYISSDVQIIGDFKAKNDVEFYGEIKGSIETAGSLKLNGSSEGNIKANTLSLENARVQGNVNSMNQLCIDKDSKVVGDISGKAIIIGGNLKGNVYAEDSVLITEQAIIKGDISTNLIDIRQGAQISGKLETGHTAKDNNVQKS